MPSIDYYNFLPDMRNLVAEIVKDLVMQDPNQVGKAFEVVNAHPNAVTIDTGLRKVYFHAETVSNGTASMCDQPRDYSFRVGIKEKCKTYQKLGDQQISIFMAAFSSEWMNGTYSFTYKGDPVTKLYDIGIRKITTTEPLITRNPDNSDQYEIRVDMTLNFDTALINALTN